MPSAEQQTQPEDTPARPAGEHVPSQRPEPKVSVAQASYGPDPEFRFGRQLAWSSLIAGLLSAGTGVSLFEVPSLLNPDSIFPGLTALICGGIWVCLGVLAIVFAQMSLGQLPKGSMYSRARVLAAVGLSLGITNLFVMLACFVLLLVQMIAPHTAGSQGLFTHG
jgi:hypothetical protein